VVTVGEQRAATAEELVQSRREARAQASHAARQACAAGMLDEQVEVIAEHRVLVNGDTEALAPALASASTVSTPCFLHFIDRVAP